MFKRIVVGSGAAGALTAAYLVGSLTVGSAFAQTTPRPETDAAPQTGQDVQQVDAAGGAADSEQADGSETPDGPEGPETAD